MSKNSNGKTLTEHQKENSDLIKKMLELLETEVDAHQARIGAQNIPETGRNTNDQFRPQDNHYLQTQQTQNSSRYDEDEDNTVQPIAIVPANIRAVDPESMLVPGHNGNPNLFIQEDEPLIGDQAAGSSCCICC